MSDLHKHLLIHNIGHHDLYLIMQDGSGIETVVVPKGTHMNSIGARVIQFLQDEDILCTSEHRPDRFIFSKPIPIALLNGEVVYHKRRKITIDAGQMEQNLNSTPPVVVGVLLPIFMPVLNKTLGSCTKGINTYHVLFFTKGGEVDELQRGSSTQNIGLILIYIVQKIYPSISFSQLHDNSVDDFSFVGRPEFFRQQVIPHIARIRREVVVHYVHEDKEKWSQCFFVHLSLNTGTTTVFISTLNALQPYRPDLFHVKRAYMWPHEPFEVEHINHQRLAQSPAVSIEHIDSSVQQFAIKKMQEWRDYFSRTKRVREQDKEVPSFFFRKGKQEVLSLVVVKLEEDEDTPEKLASFRGVNLEVSMPTGSLCAERNAIGSALVHNPNLKRENILCIAVLSLGKKGPTLGPCGACQEWLRKVSMVNPDLSILTFANLECTQVYINPIPRE